MTAAFRTHAFAFLLASSAAVGLALPAGAETVLHKGNGGEAQTLDSILTSTNLEEFVVADLGEGLTIYDAHGKIAPGTAESWTISPDGTVYTFKIRANAKWSNGDPVTANDFVFTFRRLQDPKVASGYSTIQYVIKNAEAINTGKMPLDQLGVKALDDKTLEITLERPTPFILEVLAHQSGLAQNQKSVEKFGSDFTKPGNLLSSGAYMLTENVANDHLTMVKNPNYWDAANVKIDKLISYPIDDLAAARRRYFAGELDLTYSATPDQVKFLRDKVGDQVHISNGVTTYYYVFDTRKAPFNDVKIRTALSLAIDREFLSDKIFEGAQKPLYSLVPEGIEGYKAAKLDFEGMSQLDREDKATQLLKEAGYSKDKPLKLEIRYNTSEAHKKVATAIAGMWKPFGVEATLLNSDTKSHYAYIQDGGSYDVARTGWVADYADPETFLSLLWTPNKALNWTHYSNPEFDALIAKSYQERDPAKRMDILHDAEAIGLRDQPMVPVMNSADMWLVSPKVKGWYDNAVNRHLTRFLSVE
ncbi:peptide ABC transporter substrate-binding protein [Labrys neptuniae]